MSHPPTRSRRTVFVVDDNDVVRRVLSGIVRQDPTLQHVGEASSGAAALDALHSIEADVVCLDVQMPGMDGLEVLRQLREKSAATRVVVVTGYATSALINDARALGVSNFVIKPFNAAKVLSAIHAAMNCEPSS